LTAASDSLVRNATKDPFIDAESVRNWAMYYAVGQDLKKPYLSAIYGEYHNCPPIMIQVGTEEALYDDSIRTAERIRATGGSADLTIFHEMVHVFQQFWNFLPESKTAIKQAADFIKQHTVRKGRFTESR
jgi:acetyl esterase/lipase